MSDQGFTVKDRRRFAGTDEAVDQAETNAKPQPEEPPQAETKAGRETGRDACGGPILPTVNLATFVFSLGTSALMNLGELPDPNTGENCQNLPLAKQTIDILGMLQQKTKGNLDEDEESLLSNLLYELRLKYVQAIKL